MIFHQINNENIQTVKNSDVNKLIILFRKSSEKFKRANNHLWFLSECLDKQIHPKFVNLKTNSKTTAAQKALLQGKII